MEFQIVQDVKSLQILNFSDTEALDALFSEILYLEATFVFDDSLFSCKLLSTRFRCVMVSSPRSQIQSEPKMIPYVRD